MAELDHNGLLVNLQHGPKIFLRNLNVFILALLCSLTFSYILVSPGHWLPMKYQWLHRSSDIRWV